jgi:hypothetical protein
MDQLPGIPAFNVLIMSSGKVHPPSSTEVAGGGLQEWGLWFSPAGQNYAKHRASSGMKACELCSLTSVASRQLVRAWEDRRW